MKRFIILMFFPVAVFSAEVPQFVTQLSWEHDGANTDHYLIECVGQSPVQVAVTERTYQLSSFGFPDGNYDCSLTPMAIETDALGNHYRGNSTPTVNFTSSSGLFTSLKIVPDEVSGFTVH